MRHLSNAVGDGPVEDQMARWYRFVRDSIRYDPFAIDLSPEANAASRPWRTSGGIASTRACSLPRGSVRWASRHGWGWPGSATTWGRRKLERLLGTDVPTPHGYAAHWNGRRWVKSTPVFNRELCERLGTAPFGLDAGGGQPIPAHGRAGRRFMEYLEDYGLFDALPRAFLHAELHREYPHCFDVPTAVGVFLRREAQADSFPASRLAWG